MAANRVARALGIGFRPRPEILKQLEGAPLSRHDKYHEFVFQWDEQFYRDRVEMAGFADAGRVLDAGCGLGQFSAALAAVNDHVVAVDRAEWMLETTRVLCERWGRPNVTVEPATLPDVEHPDESFDAIWCSGVLMFTERQKTMATFHRLLRPGGRLYAMVNGRGRWLYKTLRGVASLDRKKTRNAFRAWRDGGAPDARPSWFRPRDVEPFCDKHGFDVLGIASDGCLDLSGTSPPRRRPMFARRFLLVLDNNVEFVAQKR